MKKLIFFLAAGLIAGSATAQDLPQPSPFAKVEQTVGLSEIALEYSRPSVKGRAIFGDLVPYEKVWRLGANACTKFTSSTDVMFGTGKLPAGKYAVFAIPSQSGNWKIVFNKDTTQWGAGSYDETKNVITVNAVAVESPFCETFTMSIGQVTMNSAVISIMWDKLKIDIPFSVKTKEAALKNIEAAIEKGEELDKVYYRAASYYNKSLNDQQMALDYIEKGLKAKETHALHFLRAQILFDKGDKKGAIAEAEIAHKLALEAESKGWADYIEEHIKEWKE